MTYVSAESGRLEVYVRPYPGPGPALQISTSGGDEPCWAGRGLELVFRRGETLFSVTLTSSGGRLTAGAAKDRYSPAASRRAVSEPVTTCRPTAGRLSLRSSATA